MVHPASLFSQVLQSISRPTFQQHARGLRSDRKSDVHLPARSARNESSGLLGGEGGIGVRIRSLPLAVLAARLVAALLGSNPCRGFSSLVLRCNEKTPARRRASLVSFGGEGGIRTRGTLLRVRRFSKPLLSTTQPPLR